MAETSFHTRSIVQTYAKSIFCNLLFREKKGVDYVNALFSFLWTTACKIIQFNRKRESFLFWYMAVSRNSQCFLLLLTDCWFHGLKSVLDIVSRKTMSLLCSVYLRNPAVQSMRLCGKERGVVTWLSMKAPLTPPVCIWWQCVGRLLLFSSALISFQLEGWGQGRWGSSCSSSVLLYEK